MSTAIIASVLSLIAMVAGWAFIILYLTRSDWYSTLPGRTIAYLVASLDLILTYATASRWLHISEELRQNIGVGVYGLLVWSICWLLLVLIAAQRGKITWDQPNYTPIRNWLKRRRWNRRHNGSLS